MDPNPAARAEPAAEIGPVDYVVLEFPGNRMTGEAFPLLLDLVERGVIRIIDLVFITRGGDDHVGVLALEDIDGDGQLDLTVFAGASSGLINDDGIADAGSVLQPDSSAAVLVYENLWAAPLTTALRRGGGTMPGLLRGIARTAVVAGTATAVSNRVSRRQAGRWAAQDGGGYVSQVPAAEAQVPVPPPAEAPGPTVDPTAARLAQLREFGGPAPAGHPHRRGVRGPERPHPRRLSLLLGRVAKARLRARAGQPAQACE